jgi:integrase
VVQKGGTNEVTRGEHLATPTVEKLLVPHGGARAFPIARRQARVQGFLDTTDIDIARLRHAGKLSEVHALFARLASEALASVGTEADDICRRGLGVLARSNLRANDDGVTELPEAEDNVAHGMLKFLAYRTRLTWGRDHADLAELELVGELEKSDEVQPEALPVGFIEADDQEAFVARSKALERDPRYQGYANREIARALLARQSWEAVEYEVLLVASAAGALMKVRSLLYDALAERVLRRLAEHRFRFWPANIDELVPPMAIKAATDAAPPPQVPAEEVRRLSDVLARWRANRGLKPDDVDKTADEWKLAVDRFVNVHGDLPLERITRAMLIEFRDLMTGMPSRVARKVKALSVREQVAAAVKDNLPTLEPASVKKQITAIRSLLELATVEHEWIVKNVAANIEVAGSSYVGDERDRLSDTEIRTIYGSRYLTAPDACSDTMFWIMFMAPFLGARPGEFCKLRPDDVLYEDGVPTMRIRRRRGQTTGDEAARRGTRQKTISSIRDIPVHWIIAEAGFMDFAALQKGRGAAWLFDDLVPDRYGDRYKLLSRRINAVLDELGVSASDKVFYSTRHSMKRETRRKRVPEQHADQIAGHTDGRTGRKYGQGVSIEDLKEEVDKLEFAGVDWDTVVMCARVRIARLLET